MCVPKISPILKVTHSSVHVNNIKLQFLLVYIETNWCQILCQLTNYLLRAISVRGRFILVKRTSSHEIWQDLLISRFSRLLKRGLWKALCDKCMSPLNKYLPILTNTYYKDDFFVGLNSLWHCWKWFQSEFFPSAWSFHGESADEKRNLVFSNSVHAV